MLLDDLPLFSFERPLPTKPFIGDHRKCILVTGERGLSSQLFWCRIRYRARHFLCAQQFRRWSQQCETKITKQNLLLGAKQNIFRLDITMNNVVVMSVLEGLCYLLNICYNVCKWKT